MILSRPLLLVTCALLTACSAASKPFGGLAQVDSTYSQVYVYRPSMLLQSGIYPDIRFDSMSVGKLKNGGYIQFRTRPGEHRLAVTGGGFLWSHSPRSFDVNFVGGETYFYKLTPVLNGLQFPAPIGGVYLNNHGYSFMQVSDQAAAVAELEKLKESVAN